jgi:hypothetical protein
MATIMATLVVSAFGLYYVGSDVVRPWISDIHIAAGLALPVMILVHIWRGRRSRAAAAILARPAQLSN